MGVFWYQFQTFIWKKYLKSKQTKYSGFVKLGVRWAERDTYQYQIVSPILNSESTNFFNEGLLRFLFQLETWEVENCVGPIRIVFFFNYSNWEKFAEKIEKINWWKHPIYSLLDTKLEQGYSDFSVRKCDNSYILPF